MGTFQQLARIGVACIVLLSLIAAPVVAQQAAPGDAEQVRTEGAGGGGERDAQTDSEAGGTENASSDSESDAEAGSDGGGGNAEGGDPAASTNETEGGEENGSDVERTARSAVSTPEAGEGGGLGDVPGPWEMTQTIANQTYQSVSEGAGMLVDTFSYVMLALPAPGDRDDPASWASPPESGTWWSSVWKIYWGLTALVVVPLGASGVYAVSRRDSRERRDHAKKVAKAMIYIFAGWVILPFALHTGNAVTLGLAPDAAEFFSSPGNTARLGVGIVLGLALAFLKIGVVLIGLAVLLVQWIAVHLLVAMWPALVAGQASGNDYLQAIGQAGIAAFVFLIVLKAGQALMLRFLFELPLGADGEGLLTLGVTIMGVAIAFLALPVWGTKKVIPRSVTTIGGGVGSSSVSETIQERAPSRETVQQKFTAVRPGSGSGSSRASSGRASTSRAGRGGGSARSDGSGWRSSARSRKRARRSSGRRRRRSSSRRRTNRDTGGN